MRIFLLYCCAAALLFPVPGQPQEPPFGHPSPKDEIDRKLPNGKSQNEEILKEEYNKSLKDAADLVELSLALQKELETGSRHVLSVSMLKKTDEIEKIAKRLRGRMRRF